jgi:hypothetical protein
MKSYRSYKNTAKEKNKRYILHPLAAKEKKSVNNQKFLQGGPDATRGSFYKKRPPWPPEAKGVEVWHYLET